MLNLENLKKAIEDMNPDTKKYNFYKWDMEIINTYDWFINIATRSNGKTTAVQRDVILNGLIKGKKSIIAKPRKDFLKTQYNENWFTELVVKTLRKYDLHIEYKRGVYYINEYEVFLNDDGEFDKSKWFKSATRFAYVIPIKQQQDYKSVIDTENVEYVIYDEFAREDHIPIKEVEDFKSLLSTVARVSNNVKVFFNGNLVQPYNPFFLEFGINVYDMEEGHTYSFLADEENPNSARIFVDFSKGVANDSKDLPKILQLKNNLQALGMNKFQKPINVLDKADWLLEVLKNHKEKFEEFYEIQFEVHLSIDEEKELIKIGSEYDFERCIFLIIYDKINDKYYFIEKNKKSIDEGLTLFINEDFEKIKFNDNDIRNNLPIFKKSDFKDITYGSINLFNILREYQ